MRMPPPGFPPYTIMERALFLRADDIKGPGAEQLQGTRTGKPAGLPARLYAVL